MSPQLISSYFSQSYRQTTDVTLLTKEVSRVIDVKKSKKITQKINQTIFLTIN